MPNAPSINLKKSHCERRATAKRASSCRERARPPARKLARLAAPSRAQVERQPAPTPPAHERSDRVTARRACPLAPGHAETPPGCAPPYAVILSELQFNPSSISLTVGQPVQLNIQNSGLADHNLSSRDSPDSIPTSNVTYQKADNDPRQLRSYEADSILDTDANSGHTSVVTFTPTKAGTFRFISNAGDDETNVMVGSFVVVAAGGQGPSAPALAAAPASVP
jgi:hypothetical protein